MDTNAVAVLRDVARSDGAFLRVRGHCMRPGLSDGDVVRVHARRMYWPGDVIVFRSRAGDLVAHRVLGWRGAGIVTKGDGCVIHDPPVARREVVGAVLMPVPFVQRLRAVRALAGLVWRRLV